MEAVITKARRRKPGREGPRPGHRDAEPLPEQTTIRLSSELQARAEALIPVVARMFGRPSVARAEVLREAIVRGLRELEREDARR